MKSRFEEFVGAVEIQFDRLREEVRQLKTNKASEKNSHTSVTSNGVIPRSCHKAQLADPSLSTGVYWIDPDGQNVGDDPNPSKLRHVLRYTIVLIVSFTDKTFYLHYCLPFLKFDRNDNYWTQHRSIDKRRPLHRSRVLYETNRVRSLTKTDRSVNQNFSRLSAVN